nr:hypothetical protein GTC16762_04780 [Pigmentibacter ruber]
MKKNLIYVFTFILSYTQQSYSKLEKNTSDENAQSILGEEDIPNLSLSRRFIPNLVYRASITTPAQIAINGGIPSNPLGNADLSDYIGRHYQFLTNLVPPLDYSYSEYAFPVGSNTSERLISEFQIDPNYLQSIPNFSYPVVDYFNYYNAINFSSRNLAHHAFTATYSNPALALRDAFYFITAYSNNYLYRPAIMTIYLYAIIPDRNFVSVTETYRNEVERLRNDPERRNEFEHLIHLNDLYTQEDQYLAFGRIPTNQIAFVDSYYFDHMNRTYRYRYLDGSGHINRERFEAFSSREASLYEGNYPIGTIPRLIPRQVVSEAASVCYINNPIHPANETAERQRRDANFTMAKKNFVTNTLCRNDQLIDFQKEFNEKATKILLKDHKGKKYCLDLHNYYLSFNENCKDSTKWLYSSAGQLITGVFDGKNQQIYCLSNPESNDYYPKSPRMKICDLNKKEQQWNMNQNDENRYFFNSALGENLNLNFSDNYIYISKNSANYNIINYKEISEKISPVYNQFSFSINLIDEPNKGIYPSFYGKLKLYDTDYLSSNNYLTYYNAHNQAIFSNNGYSNKVGPQVCYTSLLIQNGGSSWDYAENQYCSTISNLEDKFKWDFKMKENELYIYDFGDNTLRYSKNRNYFYVGGKNWYDSSLNYTAPKYDSFHKKSNLSQIFSIPELNLKK